MKISIIFVSVCNFFTLKEIFIKMCIALQLWESLNLYSSEFISVCCASDVTGLIF